MPRVTFTKRWRGNIKGSTIELTEEQIAKLRSYGDVQFTVESGEVTTENATESEPAKTPELSEEAAPGVELSSKPAPRVRRKKKTPAETPDG